jgi:hypothetical protein
MSSVALSLPDELGAEPAAILQRVSIQLLAFLEGGHDHRVLRRTK